MTAQLGYAGTVKRRGTGGGTEFGKEQHKDVSWDELGTLGKPVLPHSN